MRARGDHGLRQRHRTLGVRQAPAASAGDTATRARSAAGGRTAGHSSARAVAGAAAGATTRGDPAVRPAGAAEPAVTGYGREGLAASGPIAALSYPARGYDRALQPSARG